MLGADADLAQAQRQAGRAGQRREPLDEGLRLARAPRLASDGSSTQPSSA